MPRLTLRIDFDQDRAIGPGKIKLLELIDTLGSIAAAGRQMGMSYRRAWLLVDSLNHCFRAPVVASQAGGPHGGGASLTEFGHSVVRHYRAVEQRRADCRRRRYRSVVGSTRRAPVAACRDDRQEGPAADVERDLAQT